MQNMSLLSTFGRAASGCRDQHPAVSNKKRAQRQSMSLWEAASIAFLGQLHPSSLESSHFNPLAIESEVLRLLNKWNHKFYKIVRAWVTDTTSGLNLEESLLCNNNCMARCHCPAFSCVVSTELRLVVSLESKSGRIFPCGQTQFTDIQMDPCPVLEKRQKCESSHKSFIITSNYSALLHPLMTFKRRVSRSLFEARIDENNINEETHCELLIRLLRALLHTTLLVWSMLCAVEYSAKPAFLTWRKVFPECWHLCIDNIFVQQPCTLMQHSQAQHGTTIWTD